MSERACGIQVFASDIDAPVEPPPGFRWGKPCVHGHGLAEGRTLRREGAGGNCVACEKEREKVKPEERKRAVPGTGERKSEKGDAAPSNVVCQRRGCTKRLSVIALRESPPTERFCSKVCAGLAVAPQRRSGVTHAASAREYDDDVSDAQLAEIAS